MQVGLVLLPLILLTLLGDPVVALVFEIAVFVPAAALSVTHRLALRR